jgi:hypothetical protein
MTSDILSLRWISSFLKITSLCHRAAFRASGGGELKEAEVRAG